MATVTLDAQATRHLLSRTTFGVSLELNKQVSAVGVDAWLAAQLRPSTLSDPVGDALMARFPRLAYSIRQTHAKVEAGVFNNWVTMEDLCVATIARAAWSKRQLFEVMVDLWSNHFNITCPSSDVWDNRHRYDADVIRRHAMGRFADMLQGVTTHPAMLRFLNNASSRKTNPNENQARELLELHSVGVGSFTEKDVKTAALVLTGLSVDQSTGVARYFPEWHYTGQVRVLGFSHPNTSTDGRPVVAALVSYLARHPATAQRVAYKLAVRFVSDDPPPALVDRLADVYLANDTAIVPVLRELFASYEFSSSVQEKVRTPYENLIASVRALSINPPASGVGPILNLYWACGNVGQQPLGWPQPDGYPDTAAAWQSASNTLRRWNMNSHLAGNWWPQGFVRPIKADYLPKPLPTTHGALIQALSKRILQRSVATVERDAICAFLGVSPSTALRSDSPAVTYELEHVIALLLNSPQQARR